MWLITNNRFDSTVIFIAIVSYNVRIAGYKLAIARSIKSYKITIQSFFLAIVSIGKNCWEIPVNSSHHQLLSKLITKWIAPCFRRQQNWFPHLFTELLTFTLILNILFIYICNFPGALYNESKWVWMLSSSKRNQTHYKSSTLLIYPKCAELLNYSYNDRMNTFIHCWFSIWWTSMGALIISDYF